MERQAEYFLYVMESHKGILYKVASAYCKNTEDRKDLIQLITLQLWKSFDRFNEQNQYSTWIFRIALNVAISFYRKEHRRKLITQPLPEGILSMPDPTHTSGYEEHIIRLKLFIADLRLFDKALMLLYLEEKTYKEIGEIMGITETNVATKINRIKTLLKQKFSTF